MKCIIHLERSKVVGGVKKLDEVRWEKLRTVVSIRKKLLKVTKYDSIVNNYPDELEDTFGYHTICLKNFTAVPKIFDDTSSSSKSNIQRRSSKPEIFSPTGVLPPKCIFCYTVRSSGESFGDSQTIDAEKMIREAAIQLNDVSLLSKIGNYMYNEGPDFCALEVK